MAAPPSTMKQRDHHELSHTLMEQQDRQVNKLKAIFTIYIDPFTYEGKDLVSLISQTVMPGKVVDDMHNAATYGEDAYKLFMNERIIQGTVNLWAPMKTIGLLTCKSVSKKTTYKIESKHIEIRSERNLF